MTWGEAAQVAQVVAVPVTAIGIIVSLMIGIGTLRELRAERQHRVQPILRFPTGAQMLKVELKDSSYLPGLDPKVILPLTAQRPKGNNRLDTTSVWGNLTNYGSGPAFDVEITFVVYRVFIGSECFVIDERRRREFPYIAIANSIPAHPSHLPPGKAAGFRRLPTPIVVDYDRKMNRIDSVIVIEYADSFKHKYVTCQGVRIFVDKEGISKGNITMTFLEEIVGDMADAGVFGPPDTTPFKLPKS